MNKPLKMSLYNSRQDEEREVTIVPRTGWGGDGLLGCAIRFSPLEGVRDRVWHILVNTKIVMRDFTTSLFRKFMKIHLLIKQV